MSDDIYLSIRKRIASIQEHSVTGIQRAFATAPMSLPDGDLPVFVNFMGTALYNWVELGADTNVETRNFPMRLYFVPRGEEGYPGETETMITPVMRKVVEVFGGRPTLENHPFIRRALVVRDSGVVEMRFANEPYWGCEFVLQVTLTIGRVYAKGE